MTPYSYSLNANPANGAGTYVSASTDVTITAIAATYEDAGTNPPTYANNGYYWQVKTPDGGTHKLASTGNHTFRAEDGSGWFFNETSYILVTEDGVRYVYAGTPDPNQGTLTYPIIGRLLYVEDSNGNQINLNYSSYVSSGVTYYELTGWTDSLGRTIPALSSIPYTSTPTSDYDGCSGAKTITSATSWMPPGGTTPIKFCFARITLNTYFFDGAAASLPGANQTEFEDTGSYVMLQSIVLPDDSTWTFQYMPLSGSQYNYGELAQIALPTGGTVGYTWAENYQLCPNSFTQNQKNSALSERILNANDGSSAQIWHYAQGFTSATNPPAYPSSLTTTDPLGGTIVHTLTPLSGTCSIFETQTDYYDNQNNKLKTETTSYLSQVDMNRINTDYVHESATAMAVFPHVKTTIWPNGATKSTTLTYDSGFTATSLDGSTTAKIPYGKVIGQVDTDYGVSAAGSTLRTTTTDYQAFHNAAFLSNNLLDRKLSVTVTDGATGRQQITTYGYDENSLISGNASSAVGQGWNSVPLAGSTRGNLTSVNRYWDTASAYLKTSRSYTDTGLVASITEPPNSAITPAASISYQHSGTYDGAFLTSTTDALGHSTSYGYDEPTGLMTSSTDQNGVVTALGYDAMHRLQSSSRKAGSHNLASSVGYTYPNPNTVARTEVLNSSIASETDTTVYDGLGRVSQTQHGDPAGTTFVDTTYDVLGRRSTVSTPYRSKTDTTAYGLTIYSYDELGRTTQVQNPDKSLSSSIYTGATTQSTSESNGTTTPQKLTRVDGLGRLIKVCEISSATPPVGTETPASCGVEIAGTGFLTSYSQTIFGMTGVTQGSQTRSFSYDSLGQLTDSTNPETGHLHYVYDTDGNVSSKSSNAPGSSPSAPASLTTSYGHDALHRMTAKNYSSSSGVAAATPSATFAYDQATVDGKTLENPIGHLTSAYTVLSGATQTKSIYSYDNAGSVESHYQCVLSTCTSAYQDVEYDFDGTENITSKTTAQNGFAYAYDPADHVTSVTPAWTTDATHPSTLLTSATYAPNGEWSVAHFGNLSNESYTYTPRWLQSLQVNGYNPSLLPHGLAAIRIDGTEQSAVVVTGSATAGKGTITITGTEHSKSCTNAASAVSPDLGPPPCTLYDGGTVTVTVSGHSDSTSWGKGSTTATLATALTSAINGDSNAPASAVASAGTITLTSKVTGSVSNYSLSVSAVDGSNGAFASSFSVTGSGFSGGANVPTTTVYDSGSLTLTVGGASQSVSFGQGSTWQAVSQALITAANANSGFTANLAYIDGQTMSVTARLGGSVGNYPMSFTATHASQFSAGSFTPVRSANALSGGADQSGTETAIYSYSLGRAPNGQIQSSTDSVNNSWSYVYDDFNRLQTATQKNSGGTVLGALAWDYDRYGNRWHQRVTAGSGTTQQISYNTATNQATSGLSYDSAGDVLNDSYHTYSYDAEGRIAQVDGSTSYIYDAEGRRVGKSDGTRYVVGLDGDVIDELNGSTWKRTEVYAAGRHLATVSPTGVTFNHVDWIGTERARTNPLGELCLTTTSQPYGDAAVSSTPSGTTSCSPTPDFLTGKPRDTESNLDDFGARYFGSRYGQWMSPDWSSSPTDVPYASMGNPQSMNLYAYVGDDPIDGQDADGHVSYLSGDGSWDGLDGFAKHEMDKAMSKPASNSGISPAQKCVGWLCWLRNVFTVNGGSSVSPSGQFSALMMAGGAAGYIEASTYMRQHPAVTRAATGAANLALLFGTDGLLSGELEAGAAASEMTAEQVAASSGELQYSERVEARSLEESGPNHNFPRSFDRDIIRNGQKSFGKNGYEQYNLRGSINGKEGSYELGIQNGQVIHRFFRPD